MLKIDHLSINYPGFNLQNVSFEVGTGEYFVLFGPTGSGKTVLFELITGLRRPEAGSIHINGRNLTRTDPACRRLGYVPQDLALIPFKTVWQNVAFGLYSRTFRPKTENRRQESREIDRRVNEILEKLKIGHLARRLPAYLSGGEKQRVALGRALVVQPDIMLLDEPLSALDEGTGNDLMREIKALHRQFGTTTLHICHRREEMLYLADRVAVMQDGAVIRIGNPDKV